ncbi:hypothetical protein [Brachyspira murdochii]|uniref:hypothetical protein n=1 Tax=Brachyspira murdochii TaxID=84378 RepID=UPI003007E9FA
MFKKQILFFNSEDLNYNSIIEEMQNTGIARAKLYFKYNEKLDTSEKFIIKKLLRVLKENKIINNNNIMSFKIKVNSCEDPNLKYRKYNRYSFYIILLSKDSKIIKLFLDYDTYYKELYHIDCILYNQYSNKKTKKLMNVLHNFLDNFNNDYKDIVFGSQNLQYKY